LKFTSIMKRTDTSVFNINFLSTSVIGFVFIIAVLSPLWDKNWGYLFMLFSFSLVVLYRLVSNKSIQGKLQLNIADAVFLVLLVYELVNYLTSIYRPNSFFYLAKISALTAFYFFVKFSINARRHIINLIYLLTVVGFLFGIYNLNYFISFYSSHDSLGDINNFKNLYQPMGIGSSEVGGVFLCLICFPTYIFFKQSTNYFITAFSLICVLLMAFGIVTTFSRGVYIAFILWIIAIPILLHKFNKGNWRPLKFAILITGIVLISGILYSPIGTTLSFNKTESQRLSTAGRLVLINSGFKIFKTNPVLGIGSYNFPLSYAVQKSQAEDVRFNGNVSNSYLSLLLEKGIIGFVIYSALIIICFLRVVRSLILPNDIVLLVVCSVSLTAILIRELFYSSILVNDYTLLLAFSIVSILINTSNHKSFITQLYHERILLITSLVFTLTVLYHLSVKMTANEHYKSGVTAFTKQYFQQSLKLFRKASTLDKSNALYQSYAALALYTTTTDFNIQDVLTKSAGINYDKKTLLDVLQQYTNADSLNRDATFSHNIAWLHFILGDHSRSIDLLKETVVRQPNVALYHVSLGIMYEKEKKLNNALHEYETAVRLSPDLLESEFFNYLKAQHPDLAKTAIVNAKLKLEKMMAESPSVKTNAKLARLNLSLNNIDTAFKQLKNVITKLPNLNRPYIYLGDIYQTGGDSSAMLKNYQMASKFNSKDFLPDLRLGNFYYNKKDFPRASRFFKNAHNKWLRVAENSNSQIMIYKLPKSINNNLIPQDLLKFTTPALIFVNGMTGDSYYDLVE